MFENPRRGKQARNFTTNAPKILDLKSSSEQIFSRKLPLAAPDRACVAFVKAGPGSYYTAKGLKMLLSTLQNRNSSVNLPVLNNFMLYTNRRIEKKRGK